MAFQLRDYQVRAVEAVYTYFENNAGNPLVVVPTGGGKSLIIGALCRDILASFPDQRILVLSHVRELLVQNFDKIKAFWPDAPAGIYCASLGEKRPRDRITVASIQSVYRKAAALGWRDLIFIDEAHLLAPDSQTMYQRFIDDLRQINRRVKVVGLTATPFRLKSGLLHEGKTRLFTDVCCEVSLAELLEAGHICPLVSKSSLVQADMTGVRITAGEFNARDAEATLDKEALTRAALDEVFALAADRRSWLVFCSGVQHAEHVRDAIRVRGVHAECVTGNTPPEERDAILQGLKDGSLQAVTNANCLTTGFDAPNIDLIVMLRATLSPGLWIQMLGRGMRPHPAKKNCLVLDFTDNTVRLGPVTHIKPPRAAGVRGPRQERSTPTCLICPKCRMASPLESLECADCGYGFERPEVIKHGATASMAEVMSATNAANQAEWLKVDSVRYLRHEKEGKIPSLRVEYTCGLLKFSEWVCLMHPPGFALGKARDWWKARASEPPPENIDTAVLLAGGIKTPRRIRVRKEDKWWKVIGYDFNETADVEDGPAAEDALTIRGDTAA